MSFEENLINYTAYSNGDLEKKCNLQYEDETIISFDFSKYDLNNSYFGGVTFENVFFKCIFEWFELWWKFFERLYIRK